MDSYDLYSSFPLKSDETQFYEHLGSKKNLLNPFSDEINLKITVLTSPIFIFIILTLFSSVWWFGLVLTTFVFLLWVYVLWSSRKYIFKNFKPFYSKQTLKEYQTHYIFTNTQIIVRDNDQELFSFSEEEEEEYGLKPFLIRNKPDKFSLDLKVVWAIEVFHKKMPYFSLKHTTKYGIIFYLITNPEDNHYSKINFGNNPTLDEDITESFLHEEHWLQLSAIFDKKDCEKIVEAYVPKDSKKIPIKKDSILFLIKDPSHFLIDKN